MVLRRESRIGAAFAFACLFAATAFASDLPAVETEAEHLPETAVRMADWTDGVSEIAVHALSGSSFYIEGIVSRGERRALVGPFDDKYYGHFLSMLAEGKGRIGRKSPLGILEAGRDEHGSLRLTFKNERMVPERTFTESRVSRPSLTGALARGVGKVLTGRGLDMGEILDEAAGGVAGDATVRSERRSLPSERTVVLTVMTVARQDVPVLLRNFGGTVPK